jgi:hypothetical protein
MIESTVALMSASSAGVLNGSTSPKMTVMAAPRLTFDNREPTHLTQDGYVGHIAGRGRGISGASNGGHDDGFQTV